MKKNRRREENGGKTVALMREGLNRSEDVDVLEFVIFFIFFGGEETFVCHVGEIEFYSILFMRN